MTVSADYIVNLFITLNETIRAPFSFNTFVLQFLICFVFEYMKIKTLGWKCHYQDVDLLLTDFI